MQLAENVQCQDVRICKIQNNHRKTCKSEWKLGGHKRIIREKDAKVSGNVVGTKE